MALVASRHEHAERIGDFSLLRNTFTYVLRAPMGV
jgi:hypothetical protein